MQKKITAVPIFFVDSEGEKDKNYWLHAIKLNVQNILILFAYA